MKILHTSDWHLGKRLESFSRIEEQIEVMNEICQIADNNQVDAVVIAGDLYDTFNPPTEAVDLFYKTLKKLTNNGKRLVVAIAGNHDSPDRIESPDPLARECGIVFIGYPNTRVQPFELESGIKIINSEEGFIEIQLANTKYPLRIIHTAYANEFRLKTFLGAENEEQELCNLLSDLWKNLSDKYCDDKGVNLFMSHLFFVKQGAPVPKEPDDEKPILHIGGAQAVYSNDLPKAMQYAALGHLHRKQYVDDDTFPIVYSGSPLSYSFAETNQDKYVILADIKPGKKAEISEIKLSSGKRLLRHRADSIDLATNWLNENQGSLVELTLVSDNFIKASDQKQLHNCHDGIISIIPEIKNTQIANQNGSTLDLSRNMTELFEEYFLHKKGQKPNDEIMALFNEILSEEVE